MTLTDTNADGPAATVSGADSGLNSFWLIVLGVCTVFTGIVAIAFPLASTLAVEVIVGSLFLTIGVLTAVHAFVQRDAAGMWWELLIGLLYSAAGIAFLLNPLGGIVAMTIMLGATFLAEGILRIVMAVQLTRSRATFLLIASGALSILLSILVFVGLINGTGLTIVGVLVGVNFIFAGVALVSAGVTADAPTDA